MSTSRNLTTPLSSIVTQLPTIKLDTTLTDLFKLARPRSAHRQLAYIHGVTHCSVGLIPCVQRNTKFLYQDGCFVETPQKDLTDKNTTLRDSLVAKFLNVIPQRDAFITGDSTVLFFGASTDMNNMTHDKHEVQSTMAVLDQSQKPRLVYCPGPSEIPFAGIDMIAGYKVAFDGLESSSDYLTVDLEKHWFLNSKGALAGSGLPTPRTEIIKVNGHPVAEDECCDVCRARNSNRISHVRDFISTVPKDCSGQRGKWFEDQERRIISAVEGRNIPFAFKTQQSLGGGGTWIVSSVQEKRELLQSLSAEDGIIQKLLALLNESNHHLQAGSMLLSDLVKDPIGNYGATFFVTDSGGVLFMGISEQLLAEDGKSWVGSIIDYRKQNKLREKLQPVMAQTAKWLNKQHGYFGPVGIDILESELSTGQTGDTDAKTCLFIVDLNVRASGSMSLPLLKGHFTKRGLVCASICTISTNKSRDTFIEQWKSEFKSGSMIIVSWYETPGSNTSMGSVIVGAVDKMSLESSVEKLRRYTDQVKF